MVKKIIIVRADFEKCAKENGKIIINPQDKFMNTMKIIELMKERNITVYKLSKMINYDRTNLKKNIKWRNKRANNIYCNSYCGCIRAKHR